MLSDKDIFDLSHSLLPSSSPSHRWSFYGVCCCFSVIKPNWNLYTHISSLLRSKRFGHRRVFITCSLVTTPIDLLSMSLSASDHDCCPGHGQSDFHVICVSMDHLSSELAALEQLSNSRSCLHEFSCSALLCH